MMKIDNFSKLPMFWKVLIIIGFITVFITFILIIVILSFLFMTPKVNLDTNIDDYDDFIESLDEDIIINEDTYPSLPKIKDLHGNILKDLLQIEIV
jgi:hypothetical protein